MSLNRFKMSFGLKIFFSYVISVVIVMTVVASVMIHRHFSLFRNGLIDEGKMLADIISRNSVTGVYAENESLLKEAASAIMNQPNVIAVSLYSADKRVLFHAGSREPEQIGAAPGGSMDKTAELRGVEIIGEDNNTISLLAPVEMGISREDLYFERSPASVKTLVIGYAGIILNKASMKREKRASIERNLTTTAAIIILGSIFIFLIVKRITEPLVKLTVSVRKFGEQGVFEPVHVESKDEIARLAETFNAMYENVSKREKEKRHLEEQLGHSQKMEAVGTLSRGVAHDFDNILSTIKGATYLLNKKIAKESPLREYTEKIDNSLERARLLTESMIVFSRSQSVRAVPVDINNLIAKIKVILADPAQQNFEIRVSLSEGELIVTADPVQIEQVVLNLCINAKDAMHEGGLLTISTQKVMAADMPQRISAKLPQGYDSAAGFAEIAVRDTGTGIHEDIKDKIFEPFFTTKEVGRGSGLGLAIVYGIVNQYNGLIDVQSKTGEGTVFKIYLPVAEKALPDMGN